MAVESTIRLETKVGLMVIAGLAATVALILLSDAVSFESHYRFTAFMEDAGGLKPGSPVDLAGIRIGQVETIATSSDPRGAIRAQVVIRQSVQIPRASQLNLSTSGIFGDSYLSFTGATDTGDHLAKDGNAWVVVAPTFLGKARARLETIADGLADLLDEPTRRSAKKLVAEGATLAEEGVLTLRSLRARSEELKTVIAEAGKLTGDLRTRTGTLGDQGEKSLTELTATLTSLRTKADDMDKRLAKLTDSATALAERGGKTLAQAEDLLTAINRDRGPLIADLAGLASRLKELAQGLAQGRGLLGQLFTSDALVRDFNRTSINVTDLSERAAKRPEILIFGDPKEERAKAEAEREKRRVRRAFMEGYEERSVGPSAGAADQRAAERP